jgi:hypothetical protein
MHQDGKSSYNAMTARCGTVDAPANMTLVENVWYRGKNWFVFRLCAKKECGHITPQ